MAIDTPARLAILGAGPIGLEAALYARFLGYDVVIYERGEVAEGVRRAGHERMVMPFVMNRTTLGIAAIEAQDESYRPPGDDELLTGQEWLDRYLLPLSQTDLLADHLLLNTTIVAVDRSLHAPREENISRSEMPTIFRVVSRDGSGAERAESFDGVLDCTGVDITNDWLGPGPDFYILGAKSRGPGAPFSMTEGYEQIRQVFATIGDREALDLYASAKRLIR